MVQDKIKDLISECKMQAIDGKMSIEQLDALMKESETRQQGFNSVFKTLQELEGTEAKVIETLFFYKINDIEEFDRETKEIVKAYKYANMS